MAISFPNGFDVTSKEPIDARLTMTKAEMLAIKKAQMPSVYICMCEDDGKLYLYNATNTVDENTGRFRVVDAQVTISSETTSLVNTSNGLEVNISTDENNILTNTENGLKVEESDSIDSNTIQNLFSNE